MLVKIALNRKWKIKNVSGPMTLHHPYNIIKFEDDSTRVIKTCQFKLAYTWMGN